MPRKNILYIWGYGSSPQSNTVKWLKNSTGNEYNIVSDYYAQYKPEEAIYDIENLIKHYKPVLIIGSSLGGYLTMQLNTNIPKLLINPCVHPEETLPTLKNDEGENVVPEHIIENYKNYTETHKPFVNINKDRTFAILATHDEVLNDKYNNDIKENCIKTVMSEQGHHNTEESINNVVAPLILEILKIKFR